MKLYKEQQARIKRLKAAEKAQEKAKKQAQKKTNRTSRSSTSGLGASQTASGTSMTQALGTFNHNPPFVTEDFENICTYLEDNKNFQQLYGSGSKTSVGTGPVTKAAAYEIFAIFINDQSMCGLRLTGKQLRSRVDAYKKKFTLTKEWAENTGAGIDEAHGGATLADILERKCTCYERMYAIFGSKHNVTPLASFDSNDGVGGIISQTASDDDEEDQNDEHQNDETDHPDNQTEHPDDQTEVADNVSGLETPLVRNNTQPLSDIEMGNSQEEGHRQLADSHDPNQLSASDSAVNRPPPSQAGVTPHAPSK